MIQSHSHVTLNEQKTQSTNKLSDSLTIYWSVLTYTLKLRTPVYLFNVLFEGEHVVLALVEWFSVVVGSIAEHAKGVNVTQFIAGLGEDVLGSKVVEGRVGVQRTTFVPLTKLKGHLEGGRRERWGGKRREGGGGRSERKRGKGERKGERKEKGGLSFGKSCFSVLPLFPPLEPPTPLIASSLLTFSK